jgi:D-alanyl-D-alanine carboxypeptidase (penicillin-binding protein 5/6)
MMTMFIVIQIVRKIRLDIKKTKLKVSKAAASVGGTSAKLKAGDSLTIYNLLNGLMLPSGNDSAHCLAEHFG